MALRAKGTAEKLEETEEYVRAVMSMTEVIPAIEVRAEFGRRLSDIANDIEALRQSDNQEYLGLIDHMVEALYDWAERAEQVLGLAATSQVPTQEYLVSKARLVRKHAEHVVEFSREQSAATIAAANASIARSIGLGASATATLFVVALIFSWRMSERISSAMQEVSAALQRLSDRESNSRSTSSSEIESMFSSLQVLEKSVQDKALIAKQLQEEKLRAEEAAHTKSRFLANMSHEIRTPINGVLGMAEILNGTELSFEQRECAQTIRKSSEALLSVINDILDFSKNEAGEVQLETRPFSLYDVVFDVAGLLGPSIGGTDVEISIDFPEALPQWFLGDPGRIRQILMNLVGNAVKFTPQGHVVIAVSYDSSRSWPLSIAVQDNGIGIAADKVDQVFDAFQQAEMHASRRFEGTGLGLAITRHLVQLMNGEVHVTSKLGEGSTFSIVLPLDVAQPIGEETGVQDLAHLRDKHVLVVDDIDLNRVILQETLSSWGMVVHCFDGPSAVLSEDPAIIEKIDIGLLDYDMPGMCGDELFTSLKSRLGASCFPMILYASSDQFTDYQDLMTQGFSGILMKPTRSAVMAQSFLNVLAPKSDTPHKVAADLLPEISGVRILIAEDNKTNRLVLDKMLKPTEAEYVFCENGLEAVKKAAEETFDLILMDMSMPVMDGLTASEKIREYEVYHNLSTTPIIALTANAMESDRDACSAAGMTDFLTKPVRKVELISRIYQATRTTHDEKM
jgi:signal transduction histidine kinase/DNA-binding response OmpR family regulator